MEMIIGGAYQGKRNYAKEQFPDMQWKDGAEVTEEELMNAAGVWNFQEYIRRQLQEEKEVTSLAQTLILRNPDVILVSQEVGYGVVPIDAFERKYREAVGRVCTELATYSKKVTRVCGGIGQVIKND